MIDNQIFPNRNPYNLIGMQRVTRGAEDFFGDVYPSQPLAYRFRHNHELLYRWFRPMARKVELGLVHSLLDLPPRAAKNLTSLISRSEQFIVAFRTAYRPNPDMPFAWLVITSRQVILCNTHRSRGVYAAHDKTDINDVRLQGKVLTIFLNDPASGDLTIPLPSDLLQDDAVTLMDAMGVSQRRPG